MSISSEIQRLQNDSTAIANAIAAKGVTVPSVSGYDDYAELINGIRTDGLNDWLKDGDTHLWLNIEYEYQKEQQLRLRIVGTIDWGDGNTQTENMTSVGTKTHTYAALGKYRIDLKPTGSFSLGGGSSTYNIMGTRSARHGIAYALYQAEIGTKKITTLTNYAFYYNYGLRSVYIPKTITGLGTYSLGRNYSLKHVEFEDSTKITTVGTYVFYYDYSLTDIGLFAPSVSSYTAMFVYCLLNEITLPSTLTDLKTSSINSTNALKKLWCLPTTPPTVDAEAAISGIIASCVVYVPFGCLSDYQAAQYWSTFSSQMVEGGTITHDMPNVSSSNKALMVEANSEYETTLTANEGYTLGTVTVTMGGTDITSTAYSNGVVSIASVTGNITITASATANS